MDLADTLERARRGEDAAIAVLVERFYPSVKKLVHEQLAHDLRRNRPWLTAVFSTGDVVHDVFVGVLRDIGEFEGDDARSFEGYLASTVTHRLLDALRFHQAARRDGRRAGAALDIARLDVASQETSPGTAAVRTEEGDVVHDALRTLSPRDRSLLEMRFQTDATYPQIAETLGLPSADAARKAVCAAQARLLFRLRMRGLERT